MKKPDYLSVDECIHGHVYKLQSRNLSLGVFNSKTNGFIGIRTKFTDRYLFEEYHWNTNGPHGTARPQEDLGKIPDDIKVCVSFGARCNKCNAIVHFDFDQEKKWLHEDGTKMCENAFACSDKNKKLFSYLETLNL